MNFYDLWRSSEAGFVGKPGGQQISSSSIEQGHDNREFILKIICSIMIKFGSFRIERTQSCLMKDLRKFGAVHVKKIQTALSSKGAEKLIRFRIVETKKRKDQIIPFCRARR